MKTKMLQKYIWLENQFFCTNLLIKHLKTHNYQHTISAKIISVMYQINNGRHGVFLDSYSM